MKKSNLRIVFNSIMKSWPKMSSLICYTEAVLITNPGSKLIRKNFNKFVDKNDYKGFKRIDVLKDTFGDMLEGKKSIPEERLNQSYY